MYKNLLTFSFLFAVISCTSDPKDISQEEELIEEATKPQMEISFTGLDDINTNPIILSSPIQVEIDATASAGIAQIEAYIDNQKIGEDTTAPYQISINPENYETGSMVVSLVAKDNLGNETTLEYNIIIHRRLLEINLPDENANPERTSYFIFASSSNGELLSIRQINPEDRKIILSTPVNVLPEDNFMITFADQKNARYGETNELTTIQNINRSNLTEINLISKPQFQSTWNPKYPSTFQIDPDLWYTDQENLSLSGGGSFDYAVFNVSNNAFTENPPTEELTVTRFDNISNYRQSEKLFLTLVNYNQRTGSQALIDVADLTPDFVITPSLFESTGFESREIILNNTGPGTEEYGGIQLLGYLNQQDMESNTYHEISGSGYELSVPKKEYFFSSIFYSYRSNISIKNYVIESIGIPDDIYSPLDWNLSYNFLENDFLISKNTDNTEILGQIFISDSFDGHQGGGTLNVMNGQEQTYKWSVIFDPNDNNIVSLPEIPEQLKEWKFYSNYLSQLHEVKQVEIRTYENISSYDEYLNLILKNNSTWYLISPKKEIIFNNGDKGIYNNPSHFLFD